ncbi:MAG TPA: hypothetical protein VFZ17_01655 [Acidimicrobiia bacterium]|nr:hypothetical protein [Acidimicrobiia bacterium]
MPTTPGRRGSRRILQAAAVVLTMVSVVAGAVVTAPTVSAASSGIALLTDVEAQDMGTFDRVTFFFRTSVCIDVCSQPVSNPLPGIASAEYVSRPILADPSGQVVGVDGNAVIRIAMSNAAGVDLSVDPPVSTYTGPLRIRPDLPNVVDIVEVGDFEGVLSWAIGIRSDQVVAQVVVEASPIVKVTVDIPHAAPVVVMRPSFTG